jgi:acyl carrier protein
MNRSEHIRHFLAENFFVGSDVSQLSDEDSLLEKGIVDSTGILDVVSFVEETFGVRVADADITPENFDTIQRLADFIERKQQPAAAV